MNCRGVGSTFSELHDGRLDPSRARRVREHLAACGACRDAFVGYERLFDSLGRLPAPLPARSFVKPPEPPGWLPPWPPAAVGRDRLRPWVRAAAAALLIATHWAVFQFAIDRDREGAQRRDGSVGLSLADASSPVVSVGPSPFQALRDHVDATELLARKLDQTPAYAQTDDLVALTRANLMQLDPQAFPELLDAARFGADARLVTQYLERVEGFRRESLRRMQGLRPSDALGVVRLLADQSGLDTALWPVQALVSSEAQGKAWERVVAVGDVDFSPDVRRFLDQERDILRARYDQAARGFARFRSERPDSSLQPLAVFMEVEAHARLRRWDRVCQVVGHHPVVYLQSNPRASSDPLGQMMRFFLANVPESSGFGPLLIPGQSISGGTFEVRFSPASAPDGR